MILNEQNATAKTRRREGRREEFKETDQDRKRATASAYLPAFYSSRLRVFAFAFEPLKREHGSPGGASR
jgi:hypothetical protein